MKKYRSHKTVHAARITSATSKDSGEVIIEINLDRNYLGDYDASQIKHSRADPFLARYWPVAGDYYIIYNRNSPDEYHSISPRAQFENGYTEIDDFNETVSSAPVPEPTSTDTREETFSRRLNALDYAIKIVEVKPHTDLIQEANRVESYLKDGYRVTDNQTGIGSQCSAATGSGEAALSDSDIERRTQSDEPMGATTSRSNTGSVGRNPLCSDEVSGGDDCVGSGRECSQGRTSTGSHDRRSAQSGRGYAEAAPGISTRSAARRLSGKYYNDLRRCGIESRRAEDLAELMAWTAINELTGAR